MEKEKEVALKGIVLKIGGKEINLTVEEAQKLKKALEGLFGKEVIKEVKHEHHHDWYTRPWVYTSDRTWWNDKYDVTCEFKDTTSGKLNDVSSGGTMMYMSVK